MPVEVELILRLLLATALGAVIGLEREKAHKHAGLRTSMLVALGAATFTILSTNGFPDSTAPARVAAGIVVGLGFLGAGAIIHREGGIVEGMTTAATIWALAGMGMAAGVGMYILAPLIAGLILLILILPNHIKQLK